MKREEKLSISGVSNYLPFDPPITNFILLNNLNITFQKYYLSDIIQISQGNITYYFLEILLIRN